MAALEREVWRIDRAGSLDRLQPVTEELPPPGPGEVRVRVRAVGLNFADVFACLGLYSATPAGSFVPGLECAGEVEASGQVLPGRPGWRPGDRVVVLTRFGAYATHVNVDSRYLHALPADWTFAEGAAWPVQTLTAWYAIGPLAAVERGDLVLVHSAAGGVGLQAIALLDGLGARAVATVGSADKARFLARHAGIDPERVIVRDRRTFPAQLDRALASAGATGFDAVLDALMGPYFAPAHARLAPEGRHVVFGAADFMSPGRRPHWLRLAWQYLRRPRVDPLAMISSNRSVMAFNLIWLWEHVERLPAAYSAIAGTARRPPLIGARFPFGAADRALEALQSGRSVGKLVLEVP